MQVFVVVFSYFVFIFFSFILLLLFNILQDCKAYFMASPDLNKTHTLCRILFSSFSFSYFLTQNLSLQGLTRHMKTIMMFIMYYKELQYAVQFIYPLRSFCFLFFFFTIFFRCLFLNSYSRLFFCNTFCFFFTSLLSVYFKNHFISPLT